MFRPEDFQLSLETQLKLRVVNDDIDKCDDINSLKEQLKSSVKLLMNYQQIINTVIKEQITRDLTDFGVDIENIQKSD